MKKKFFALCGGITILLTGLLVFAACEQPVPEVKDITRQIEVSGIPKTIDGGAASFKIFAQISSGMGIDDGYVAKGEVLIGGRNTVIMDLFDPYGQSWGGEGQYNIAVVISAQTVTGTDDIMVRAAMPKLSSRVQSFAWGGASLNLDLKTMLMFQQVQDVFEGIVCAAEETAVTHPTHWAWTSDDGKKTAVLLLSGDGLSFSLNLAQRLELNNLFLLKGAWNPAATADGSFTLKNPSVDNKAGSTADTHAGKVPGLAGKTVTFTYTENDTKLTLASTDPAAREFFGGVYKKK